MTYNHLPNDLLEAISYLGRRASNNTWDTIENKILKRNVKISSEFEETFSKLKAITKCIDNSLPIEQDVLHRIFGNIHGFSFNTIGSFSIAFLIYYSVFEEFPCDFDKLLISMQNFSQERIAYNIAEALDLSDNCKTQGRMTDREFMDSILSLSIPAESKIAIFDTYANYKKYLEESSKYIKPVINNLEKYRDEFCDISSCFSNTIEKLGCETAFNSISQFKLVSGVNYVLRPFIFGMDTVLVSNPNMGKSYIYCGILRKELLEMLNKQVSNVDDLYEAFSLLGDKTRFDILCFLKNNSAYGQELSNHFNLSRNTIHHHMSKLINYGFVTCTSDGNRVYYSLDIDTFKNFIDIQQNFFCLQ